LEKSVIVSLAESIFVDLFTQNDVHWQFVKTLLDEHIERKFIND